MIAQLIDGQVLVARLVAIERATEIEIGIGLMWHVSRHACGIGIPRRVVSRCQRTTRTGRESGVKRLRIERGVSTLAQYSRMLKLRSNQIAWKGEIRRDNIEMVKWKIAVPNVE